MDAQSSSHAGLAGVVRTHPTDRTRSRDRLSLSAALGLLALVAACSTVAPPTDPEPVANPAPIRPQADDATQAKPPAKSPRRISRWPARRAPTESGSGAGSANAGEDTVVAGPEPRAEPLHVSANRPYRLNGRQYRPMTQLQPFRQQGIASWYGVPFHGRRTATGDRFDMNGMSAAHPTLPLPSYARVRNLKNGKAVIVRVNDRGPFASDRVIDLSRAAANHLGMIDSGVASVEVELMVPDDDDDDDDDDGPAEAVASK